MTILTITKRFQHDSPDITIMPPKVFYICLILGGALELIFPSKLPMVSTPMRLALSLLLGGSGFAFMLIAHEKFKRLGTNVPPNRPAKTFVVRGAYRISRNPMYVGGSAFFLGIGVMAGSLWMLAAYIPLGLYLSLYVVPREEAYMERTFGDDYRAYCRHVRRWL